MVTAKEFWNYLCEDLKYRFFSGVPCLEFRSLYNTMSSKFMHYIPAVDVNVALAISSGVRLAGMKSGVLFHIRDLSKMASVLYNFNTVYRLPVLLICFWDKQYVCKKVKLPFEVFSGDLKSIGMVVKRMEHSETPYMLAIKEEISE